MTSLKTYNNYFKLSAINKSVKIIITVIKETVFWSYRNVIGPTMAGALTQWLSYAWATTVSTLALSL